MAAPSHYVIIPFPVYSHVNPLIQFSALLASQGAEVSFVTSSFTHERAVSTLASLLQADQKQKIIFWKLQNEQPTVSDDIESVGVHLQFMIEQAEELAEIVAYSANKCHHVELVLDFVIYSSLVDKLSCGASISSSVFWTSTAANMVIHFFMKMLLEKGYLPYNETRPVIHSSLIPGMPELIVREDIPYNLKDEYTARLPIFHMDAMLLAASKVFINSFKIEQAAIDVLRDAGVNVISVGPLVVQTSGIEHNILTWLASKEQKSVLYVCFGTLVSLTKEQLEELAYGLENSGYPFLWSLSKKCIPLLPENFTETTKGLVVTWCNQLEVLKNSSVGAFLTHCGWNSVMESIICGVPMLGYPMICEQNLNCKYIADVWNIGKKLLNEGRDPTREEISMAIKVVMEDEDMRSNTFKWGIAACEEQNLNSIADFGIMGTKLQNEEPQRHFQ